MTDKKDISKDTRFRFPVPGRIFFFRGQDVDLQTISEERAMQLAKDPACKFLRLANTPVEAPAPPELPTKK